MTTDTTDAVPLLCPRCRAELARATDHILIPGPGCLVTGFVELTCRACKFRKKWRPTPIDTVEKKE